jgi:hypothetical protein
MHLRSTNGCNSLSTKRFAIVSFRVITFLFFLFGAAHLCAQVPEARLRTLIVVFDGLRPDYITEDLMPNVFAFKNEGCYGLSHHSVFPTVTRVNASSYVTGSYPHRHGLMGNTVFFPEVDSTKGLNTGDVDQLMRIQRATDNGLLTSVTLGEILRSSGYSLMVFSSGSTGQAYLQNPMTDGAVINPSLILPDALRADVIAKVGSPPASSHPNRLQHEWATRALIQYGLATGGPLVNAIWFSDPDGTAHEQGIGSPAALESLKVVDAAFGEILHALTERGLRSSLNIIITADHGFVTEAGKSSLAEFLVTSGLKRSKTSTDVVLAGNAIYVHQHDPVLTRKIVLALQQQPWVGALFTSGQHTGDMKGWVTGTLSFESIYWDHPTRTADILVDYNWDNGKNGFGYEGRSMAPGVAGHGGSSPYETHIPLIASGPSFRKNYQSALPTSNVDIVPTILYINHLPIPPQMEGRVMRELLSGMPARDVSKAKKKTTEAKIRESWGTYRVVLETSVIGKYSYVNQTRVERSSAASNSR